MKEGQKAIYYITADSFAAAKNSPHLEIFRKKGVEVLLLSERVDEWAISNLQEYAGKELHSVAKGALDLGELDDAAEKEQQKQQETEFKDLLGALQGTLGDKVKEVRVTHRLTDSPACLVAGEHDMSQNLQRLLKSAGQNVRESQPILEINPEHPLVKKLKAEQGSERFNDWGALLFDQALLAEGGQLEDPAGFVKRMNSMMLSLSA